MSVKREIIAEIFNTCKKRNNFIFDNELIKPLCIEYGFSNPFDVTKTDNTSILPQILLDEDYFILHLGLGYHKFVKGIKIGFHSFEEIEEKNINNWTYRKSILNEFDTSESNILSVVNNQKITHDFLYNDIVESPKVYNARRTKASLSFYVGEEQIQTQKLQMEIDLTMELRGLVTVFEGKNGFPKNFAVYQIFNPFKYYSDLKNINKLNIKKITCCYVLRKRVKNESVIRLYNYTFTDENNMASIKLLKSAQYNLMMR